MSDTHDLKPGTRHHSWVAEEFGIILRDKGFPVGLRVGELIEVGLRRNPRRAQLLVSTVLGKHLAADPLVIAGAGRLLGALVARLLDADQGSPPESWAVAANRTVSGEHPAALVELLDGVPPPDTDDVLTFGFAETATSLGHLVADQLSSDYLHSTRRRDGSVPIAAEFAEPHSHATGHLLRPDPAELLAGIGPIVLVDDELSTGRTALNVIEAMHALAPRSRYVLAGLVDVRSAADDLNRAAVAHRLGCRIDVVSLVCAEIELPAGIVDRVAAELVIVDGTSRSEPAAVQSGTLQSSAVRSGISLPWPVDLPTGGRHGFQALQRPAFDEAVRLAAAALAVAVGDAGRVLVLGTEELMYLPLRLALELAQGPSRDPFRRIVFQSTTRSPVHPIDRSGYPIRRRIDFRSAVLGEPDPVLRHVYNVCWPGHPDSAESALREADLVVVVDDGHALPGADGVVEAVHAATSVPVLLAQLTPRPSR